METRCVMCKRETAEYGLICNSCVKFLKWKYKKRWKKELQRVLSEIEPDPSIEDSHSNLNSQRRKK